LTLGDNEFLVGKLKLTDLKTKTVCLFLHILDLFEEIIVLFMLNSGVLRVLNQFEVRIRQIEL
jgi:hypothetical protein